VFKTFLVIFPTFFIEKTMTNNSSYNYDYVQIKETSFCMSCLNKTVAAVIPACTLIFDKSQNYRMHRTIMYNVNVVNDVLH